MHLDQCTSYNEAVLISPQWFQVCEGTSTVMYTTVYLLHYEQLIDQSQVKNLKKKWLCRTGGLTGFYGKVI